MSGNSGSTSRATAPGIDRFELGPFLTNSYIVTIPESEECWIVDAGFDPSPLLRAVQERGLKPAAIVLTHAHVDHIAGIREARAALGEVPIWMHGAEAEWLTDPLLNLSEMMGAPVTAPGPDRLLEDGERLRLGESEWTVLHVPGHSPGSIALHHGPSEQAVVGDTLFAGSIGRTDFPGSDHGALMRSIRNRLYAMSDRTVIYPGHGPPTTIGREKASNPFVRP